MDNGVEALFGFVGTHGDALEFLEYRPCATASQSATATFARLIRRAALSETYRRTATSPRLIPYVDGSPLQVFFADFLIGSLASICSAFRCGRTGPLAKMVS
ncbi:hypothetical protein ACFHWW_28980, partial [Ensifer sp. P24N7]|uniref:hypothetical protein n=1 Tax=Sinorhizobium sp. P24N7 TaxID=3348358 RepID=UPI0035F2C8D6